MCVRLFYVSAYDRHYNLIRVSKAIPIEEAETLSENLKNQGLLTIIYDEDSGSDKELLYNKV